MSGKHLVRGFSESPTSELIGFGLPFCRHRDVAKCILHVWCLQTDEVITSWAIHVAFPIDQDAVRTAGTLLAVVLAPSSEILTNY